MDTYYATLPLRAVVGVRYTESGYPLEDLACGHSATPPLNPYSGIKVARRRRCWQCGDPFRELVARTKWEAQNDADNGRSYL